MICRLLVIHVISVFLVFLMDPSYDCEGSSLFCPEDNNSIMSFDDDGHDNDGEAKYQHGHHQSQSLLVDFLMDFPLQTDECLGLMIESECQHMPREDYMVRLQSGMLDSSLRRGAIDWIWKVGIFAFPN